MQSYHLLYTPHLYIAIKSSICFKKSEKIYFNEKKQKKTSGITSSSYKSNNRKSRYISSLKRDFNK